MKLESLPEYIAAKDAVRELNLPYTTLRTAHFNGELPALKIGKKDSRRESWYFKRVDLLAWLERRTTTMPSKPTRMKPRIVA